MPFCLSHFFITFAKNNYMTFDIVFVGYIAGFCTAVAQFPQALKVIKTGETHSISLGMYIIMTFGIFFWFLYGVLLTDFPMIIANFVCLIPSLYILYITIRNLNKAKKHST
jgi:MtN3 and saliva related transmembrane protein